MFLLLHLHFGGNQPWIDDKGEGAWFWILAFNSTNMYWDPMMWQTLDGGCHHGTRQVTVPALWELTACAVCRPSSFLKHFPLLWHENTNANLPQPFVRQNQGFDQAIGFFFFTQSNLLLLFLIIQAEPREWIQNKQRLETLETCSGLLF